MIQEYLLTDESCKDKIKEVLEEKIQMHFNKLGSTEFFVCQLFLGGDNEDIAKKLSKTHKTIMNICSPTILTHGCSEYFNKRLFPLVNDFELKLRKLLYLYSALHKNDKSVENIEQLDQKEFGALFEMLFADDEFIKKAKGKANQTPWKYTKTELVSMIEAIEEKTVWDTLIGADIIPSLRKNFSAVRLYRNDVMHAHYISYEEFSKAKRLYEDINKEIDAEINRLIAPSPELVDTEFNDTLNSVIKSDADSRDEVPGGIFEMAKQMLRLQQILGPELIETQKIARSLKESIGAAEELRRTLSPSYMEELKEQIKLLKEFKIS